MALTTQQADVFAQQVHDQVTEVMEAAGATTEEVNRLFDLSTLLQNQAFDLGRAAERRVRQMPARDKGTSP
jgi:stage III sporulation protein SpoIIIAA